MPTSSRCRRIAAWLVVALPVACGPIPSRSEPAVPAARPAIGNGSATPEELAAVILQLGHDDYAVRERAAARLAGLGAAAADELLAAAETSPDLEVALRAQGLVEAISPLSPADPPAAAEAMAAYVRAAPDARPPIQHKLLRLEDDAGIEPLARIVRLERTPALAATAAALLVQEWRPGDPFWPQLRPRIAAGVAASRRPAARFLRALVAATDPGAVDRRPAAIAEATEALAILEQDRHRDPGAAAGGPARTPQEAATLRLLRRGLVDVLIAADRRADAVRELEHLFLADRDRAEDGQVADAFTVDNLAWAVEHGLPEAVEIVEQADWMPADAKQDPAVTYARAVAWRARGRADQARALADEAAAAIGNTVDPPNTRLDVASNLVKWGAADWAEREFGALADDPATPAATCAVAGIMRSEFLHDQSRHDEAAAVLRRLFEERTREFRAEVEGTLRMIRDDPELVRARMVYFAACAAGGRGDAAGQRRLLEQALRHSAQDVDALIALHRLAGTPRQKAEAAARVTRAVEELEQRITAPGEPDANAYNEYAWLVANTAGDVAKATRYSLRSLELSPDSASYLDTLAHCRAATGNFRAAVRTQTLAARREPHNLTIRRNLERFRAEADGGPR